MKVSFIKQLQTIEYTAILNYSITSRLLVVYKVQSIEKLKSRDLDLEK